MRDLIGPALAITAALAVLLAYSASRPQPEPLIWKLANDSDAPKARIRIERTGEKFDRAVFDRNEYEVSYRGDEIVVEPKASATR